MSLNNNNKLNYRHGAGKNKKLLLKGSIIERTLEIGMPSISTKVAIGLDRTNLIDPKGKSLYSITSFSERSSRARGAIVDKPVPD